MIYTPTAAGNHVLTAAYLGDQNTAPSTSTPLVETIFAPSVTTTTTIYPSLNPSPDDKPILLTATVTPTPGSGTPTGTVTFIANETTIGTVPVGPDGRALLLTDLTQIASNTPSSPVELTASYSGDATFSASTSPTIQEIIGPADGPEVSSLARVGPGGSASALVLTFDEALHPATAQDPSNYVIVGPTGRRIPIRFVNYDPATQSVTVTPRSRLAAKSTYVLTVIGIGPTGVTDADGRFLDGEYVGHPGSNYSTAIVPRKLVLSRSVPTAPKVNHRTQLAVLRAEMAAYRASLVAARRHR